MERKYVVSNDPREDSLLTTAIRARGLLLSRWSQMRTTLVRLTARLRAVSSKSCCANVFGMSKPEAST